jgi:hypothetical protein
MTREELFKQVLKDMGEDVEGKSSQDIYDLAVDKDLTTRSREQFEGSRAVTREEAAVVMGRALEKGENIPEYGAGVEYAMGRGLYSGFGPSRDPGTGQEAFQRRYYEGNVGTEFRAALALQNAGRTGTDEPSGDRIPTVLDDEAVKEAQRIQDAENALEIIKDKLRDYGLEGLADVAYEMLIDGVSAEAAVLRLRETEEFQNRFSGMAMRRENGMSAISPAEYINLERGYRQVMMAAGIPEGFYDSPDDFAEFIGNDVSQNEMTQRVSMAASAVQSVDPNLKTQLQDLYGIGVENDGELVAYFLDPDRGVTMIEQRLQLESAGLSAATVSTLGGGLERQTAEQLADLNVQRREVTERLQGQRGLTQRMVGEEDAVTTSELAAAEFGLDSEATADIARLRQQRQQRGRRQMGALVTGAGATGLGRAT